MIPTLMRLNPLSTGLAVTPVGALEVTPVGGLDVTPVGKCRRIMSCGIPEEFQSCEVRSRLALIKAVRIETRVSAHHYDRGAERAGQIEKQRASSTA